MANGSLINNLGKNIMLNRTYTANGSLSATQYLTPTVFKIGVNNGTPVVSDTDLDFAVPIENGTVNDDGDNQLTGSSGGDNTTDNTTTFKQGAGVTDDTSQDLIANGTNATKIWTIADLSANGTNVTQTKPFALWLYIKDATALAKFKSSGTCLEVKLGSAVGDYFSKTWTAADLAVGWNWITSNTVAVEDLTETGTVAGNVDTFIIEIITNNATDTFTTGDVLYDLLRTWVAADLISTFSSGYPSLDYTNNEAEIRCYLNTLKANGFLINGQAIFNEDTSPLMHNEATIDGESKSLTDEFVYIVKNRIL